MAVSSYFSDTYSESRSKLLRAAARAGAAIRSLRYPALGPAGEDLYTDVAVLNANSSKALVTISGTHGIEGFCGAGCQVGWFESGLYRCLPDDVGLIVIHALNPHGFAWLRRVTHEGVDLNRNFVDHATPPRNARYGDLAAALVPKEWHGPIKDQADKILSEYRRQYGERRFQEAVTNGQYEHPSGLFYGGSSPTVSRRHLESIITMELHRCTDVAVIDYHTGLGSFGGAELITPEAVGSEGYFRARRWYRENVRSARSTAHATFESLSTEVDGPIENVFAIQNVTTTYIALEYGTVPFDMMIEALRADHWLHAFGKLTCSEASILKRQIKDAFYPNTAVWQEMVWQMSIATTIQALSGLGDLSLPRQ